MIDHFYQDIQGYFDETFADIYREAVERAPKDRLSRFVEVGSWKGKSAAFMAVEITNQRKPVNLYCVDKWAGKDTWPDKVLEPYFTPRALINDPDIERIYDIFCDNLSPFPWVIPMRMPSLEGATAFQDGTLDFVMIDASHDYEDVRDDILAWSPKLRPDGVLAGDDYSWPGVWRAVRELIGVKNVRRHGQQWVRKCSSGDPA